jgi:hypothetical protein
MTTAGRTAAPSIALATLNSKTMSLTPRDVFVLLPLLSDLI